MTTLPPHHRLCNLQKLLDTRNNLLDRYSKRYSLVNDIMFHPPYPSEYDFELANSTEEGGSANIDQAVIQILMMGLGGDDDDSGNTSSSRSRLEPILRFVQQTQMRVIFIPWCHEHEVKPGDDAATAEQATPLSPHSVKLGLSGGEKMPPIPCLYVTCASATRLIIMFHGNATDLSPSTSSVLYRMMSVQNNASIIVVEYPGYGLHIGHPCERDVLMTAERVVQFVFSTASADFSPAHVVVMGRSIGGGSATHIAKRIHECLVAGDPGLASPSQVMSSSSGGSSSDSNALGGLVLKCPFASIKRTISPHFAEDISRLKQEAGLPDSQSQVDQLRSEARKVPFLFAVGKSLIFDRFQNIEALEQCDAFYPPYETPVLLVHGMADRVISVDNSTLLAFAHLCQHIKRQQRQQHNNSNVNANTTTASAPQRPKNFTFLPIPGKGHNDLTGMDEVRAFFSRLPPPPRPSSTSATPSSVVAALPAAAATTMNSLLFQHGRSLSAADAEVLYQKGKESAQTYRFVTHGLLFVCALGLAVLCALAAHYDLRVSIVVWLALESAVLAGIAVVSLLRVEFGLRRKKQEVALSYWIARLVVYVFCAATPYIYAPVLLWGEDIDWLGGGDGGKLPMLHNCTRQQAVAAGGVKSAACSNAQAVANVAWASTLACFVCHWMHLLWTVAICNK